MKTFAFATLPATARAAHAIPVRKERFVVHIQALYHASMFESRDFSTRPSFPQILRLLPVLPVLLGKTNAAQHEIRQPYIAT